jgi:hypothetical protein
VIRRPLRGTIRSHNPVQCLPPIDILPIVELP